MQANLEQPNKFSIKLAQLIEQVDADTIDKATLLVMLQASLNDMRALEDIIPIIHDEEATETIYQRYGKEIAEKIITARSAGFYAMVVTKENGAIDASKLSINIRHAGEQARHVTPICFVQNALIYAIRDDMTPIDAIKSLLNRAQTLLPSKPIYIKEAIDSNTYVQAIFEYFGHLGEAATHSDVTNLFILLACLYNELPYLAMNDNYQKIASNTHQRYFVPRPVFFNSKSKLAHSQEGSFISAHQKTLLGYEFILRIAHGLEENIDDMRQLVDVFTRSKPVSPFLPTALTAPEPKDPRENFSIKAVIQRASPHTILSDQEVAQVVYSVYATFDYLPISSAAVSATLKAPNAEHHRWIDEPIQRLHVLVANHLRLFFAAHPALCDLYQAEIINGFIHHVAFGVTGDQVEKLYGKKNDDLMQQFSCTGFFKPDQLTEFHQFKQAILAILRAEDHSLAIHEVDNELQTFSQLVDDAWIAEEIASEAVATDPTDDMIPLEPLEPLEPREPRPVRKRRRQQVEDTQEATAAFEAAFKQSDSYVADDPEYNNQLCQSIELLIHADQDNEQYRHGLQTAILSIDMQYLVNFINPESGDPLLISAVKNNYALAVSLIVGRMKTIDYLSAIDNAGNNVFELIAASNSAELAATLANAMQQNELLVDDFPEIAAEFPDFAALLPRKAQRPLSTALLMSQFGMHQSTQSSAQSDKKSESSVENEVKPMQVAKSITTLS